MLLQKIKCHLSRIFIFIDNSVLRDDWVIKKLAALEQGSSILDAGAGECKYKKYCKQLKYLSQDFNKYDGKGNNDGLQTGKWNRENIDIVSDITAIPVKDESFDAILCTEVFEHIPFPDKAVTEFARIIKKGGKLILTAPFCSQTHFAPFHFFSGFNYYWYEKVLQTHKLKIIEYTRLGNYFDFINQELLRTPLTLKQYSKIGILAYLLYVLIIPIVFLIYILSLLTKNSEKQLFFSSFILAEKQSAKP